MFAHGANPKEFELRASEIKGEMRFWFRTALSSKLKNNIKALKFIESYIFGDTHQKSKVIVSVDGKLNPRKDEIKGKSFKSGSKAVDPIKYIAYGMYDKGIWHGYADRGTFKINLSFFSVKKDGSLNREEIQKIESITDSLILFYSTFGGIGAKTGKGFGSFQVKQVKSMEFDPKNLSEKIKDAVENIYQNSKSIFESNGIDFGPIKSDGFPTYPFFNPLDDNDKRYGFFPLQSSNYVEALSCVGEKYYAFRRDLDKDKKAFLGSSKKSNGRKTSILHMSLKKYNSKYHLIYVFLPSLVGESNELNADGQTVKLFSKLNDICSQFKNTWEAK